MTREAAQKTLYALRSARGWIRDMSMGDTEGDGPEAAIMEDLDIAISHVVLIAEGETP